MPFPFGRPRPSYRCLDTGVHLVPLQAMTGQLMTSTGTCVLCLQRITAQVVLTAVRAP